MIATDAPSPDVILLESFLWGYVCRNICIQITYQQNKWVEETNPWECIPCNKYHITKHMERCWGLSILSQLKWILVSYVLSNLCSRIVWYSTNTQSLCCCFLINHHKFIHMFDTPTDTAGHKVAFPPKSMHFLK